MTTMIEENINLKEIDSKRHIWNYNAYTGVDFDINFALRKIKHIINALNLSSKPEKVKVRQNGITASGIPNECHCNVAYIVKRFGGKRVIGYAVHYYPEKKKVRLFSHSVWETPEGKLTDVTARGYGSEYTYFYPVKTMNNLIEKHYYILNWEFDVYEDVHKGVTMENPKSENHLTHKWFKQIRKSTFSKDNVIRIDSNFYDGDYYNRWIKKVMKVQEVLKKIA